VRSRERSNDGTASRRAGTARGRDPVSAPTGPPVIRRTELMAAMALATDLAMGQPLGHFLHTTLVAVALGRSTGLDRAALQQVHEVALLRMIGCTGESPAAAHVFGDEVAARSWIQGLDYGSPAAFMSAILREQGRGLPMMTRLALIARTFARASEMADAPRAHCEIAAMLALRMGFSPATAGVLKDVYERWDGRGVPNGKKGDAIPFAARVVYLADDLAVHGRLGGREGAIRVARERRGAAYDPALVRLVEENPSVLASLDEAGPWKAVLDAEPEPAWLDDDGLDEGLLAMADFTDLKSYALMGHCRRVADLAAAAVERLGLPPSDVHLAWRAGLLHDLGRVAVPTAIWDKPGSLTDAEWESVRLHPYHGERCVARSPLLARLAAIGTADHERADGSGYPKGAQTNALSSVMRVLAVADAYAAMEEARPHRPALARDDIAKELQSGARAGAYDETIVEAVLGAAGHAVPRKRRERKHGLSDREIEVLRLVARGRSNKEIARALSISPKTVDNHLQKIFPTIGVTTRAAAAVYAADHDLLG
jgi:HD-GYP domain-containing protein (c-di-GMP phosphodiesterase class II)